MIIIVKENQNLLIRILFEPSSIKKINKNQIWSHNPKIKDIKYRVSIKAMHH